MSANRNVLRNNLDEDLRRHVCRVLIDSGLMSTVAQACPDVNLHLLPEYVVNVPYPFVSNKIRYFVPLSLKQKGKRRVYCDAGFDRTANTLYLSYLGKKDLLAIRPEIYPIKPYLDMLGNRWVITVGKPVTEMKQLHVILEHLVALQTAPSTSNKPIDDDHPIAWAMFGADVPHMPHLSGCAEMLCTVQKYKA